MDFEIILSNAENLAEVFDGSNDLIRFDNVSAKELEIINAVVSRNDSIMLIALPLPPEPETGVV